MRERKRFKINMLGAIGDDVYTDKIIKALENY